MRAKKTATTKKVSVRDAIVRAAIELVEVKGAGAMTLDAVAARAGVSKGGLMHHFKTKEALLTALIEQVTETFERESQASAAKLASKSEDSTAHEVDLMTTYLDRAFAGLGTRNHGAMALFAAAVHQPDLLQPVRDYFARRTQETLRQSRNPKAALAMMMLADGLWLFDALGIPEFSGSLRRDIAAQVKQWTREILESGRAMPAAEPPKPATRSATKRPAKRKMA